MGQYSHVLDLEVFVCLFDIFFIDKSFKAAIKLEQIKFILSTHVARNLRKDKVRINAMTSYIPGADNDLSMNFFLAKQSQNLEGFPSSVQKTLSTNLEPISCLACVKYCLNKSI